MAIGPFFPGTFYPFFPFLFGLGGIAFNPLSGIISAEAFRNLGYGVWLYPPLGWSCPPLLP